MPKEFTSRRSPCDYGVELTSTAVVDHANGRTYFFDEVFIRVSDYGDGFFDVGFVHGEDLVGDAISAGVTLGTALRIADDLSQGRLDIKRVPTFPANGVFILTEEGFYA